MRVDAETRFWKKVDKNGPVFADKGLCWIWTASMYEGGYGYFSVDKKSVRAHRFAYKLLIGEIPVGFDIHHLCQNHACVNPTHLELLTHANHPRGERNGKAKLTEEDIVLIRRCYAEGKWSQQQLATHFEISQRQIARIIISKQWSHIPLPTGEEA